MDLGPPLQQRLFEYPDLAMIFATCGSISRRWATRNRRVAYGRDLCPRPYFAYGNQITRVSEATARFIVELGRPPLVEEVEGEAM